MSEVWKDVPEYEGLYQISNLGRVKSLSRTVFHPFLKAVRIPEKLLRSTNTSSKGIYYSFCKDGMRKTINISPLIIKLWGP